ncbi:MAG: glycosyltransferase family 4 protein [Armatimonadota bacterium]|nr:glycosyltransferase family 4 protein [Armatimonadota bacterium]MCX7777721.1 glycosyltransferase family 4 protein [Armatimonadota bacterium]MDW8025864.1 glycosyltransferase family 4 protein [Armatimonadota bacterium]
MGIQSDAVKVRVAMMRLMLISHACAHQSYLRSKLSPLLKARSDLHALVITPKWWVEGSCKVSGKPISLRHNEGIAISIQSLTLFTGLQFAHFYPMLHTLILRWKPEIVHVEEEPMSLSCAHAALLTKMLARQSPFIFFTWENLHQRWSMPNLRSIAYPLFERLSYAYADIAIAGTEMAMRILRERGFEKPIVVCPQFGIDVERFSPMTPSQKALLRSKLGLANGAFTIGYVGRIVPEKGIDLLMHAIAEIPKAQLLIAGDGWMLQTLKELSEKLGIQKRVKFIGAVPHEELPELLNAFDALVLPSRSMPHWREQFGRVLIEAMACGTPVIGSSSGAIPEVIGDCGLVFQEGNIDELRSHILRIANDERLKSELSTRGRMRAVEQFSSEVIALRTVKAYELAMSISK